MSPADDAPAATVAPAAAAAVVRLYVNIDALVIYEGETQHAPLLSAGTSPAPRLNAAAPTSPSLSAHLVDLTSLVGAPVRRTVRVPRAVMGGRMCPPPDVGDLATGASGLELGRSGPRVTFRSVPFASLLLDFACLRGMEVVIFSINWDAPTLDEMLDTFGWGDRMRIVLRGAEGGGGADTLYRTFAATLGLASIQHHWRILVLEPAHRSAAGGSSSRSRRGGGGRSVFERGGAAAWHPLHRHHVVTVDQTSWMGCLPALAWVTRIADVFHAQQPPGGPSVDLISSSDRGSPAGPRSSVGVIAQSVRLTFLQHACVLVPPDAPDAALIAAVVAAHGGKTIHTDGVGTIGPTHVIYHSCDEQQRPAFSHLLFRAGADVPQLVDSAWVFASVECGVLLPGHLFFPHPQVDAFLCARRPAVSALFSMVALCRQTMGLFGAGWKRGGAALTAGGRSGGGPTIDSASRLVAFLSRTKAAAVAPPANRKRGRDLPTLAGKAPASKSVGAVLDAGKRRCLGEQTEVDRLDLLAVSSSEDDGTSSNSSDSRDGHSDDNDDNDGAPDDPRRRAADRRVLVIDDEMGTATPGIPLDVFLLPATTTTTGAAGGDVTTAPRSVVVRCAPSSSMGAGRDPPSLTCAVHPARLHPAAQLLAGILIARLVCPPSRCRRWCPSLTLSKLLHACNVVQLGGAGAATKGPMHPSTSKAAAVTSAAAVAWKDVIVSVLDSTTAGAWLASRLSAAGAVSSSSSHGTGPQRPQSLPATIRVTANDFIVSPDGSLVAVADRGEVHPSMRLTDDQAARLRAWKANEYFFRDAVCQTSSQGATERRDATTAMDPTAPSISRDLTAPSISREMSWTAAQLGPTPIPISVRQLPPSAVETLLPAVAIAGPAPTKAPPDSAPPVVSAVSATIPASSSVVRRPAATPPSASVAVAPSSLPSSFWFTDGTAEVPFSRPVAQARQEDEFGVRHYIDPAPPESERTASGGAARASPGGCSSPQAAVDPALRTFPTRIFVSGLTASFHTPQSVLQCLAAIFPVLAQSLTADPVGHRLPPDALIVELSLRDAPVAMAVLGLQQWALLGGTTMYFSSMPPPGVL